jgi:hypothetical protein
MAVGIRHADHVAPSNPQKLAITSPTSGGRSVGIVRSRTQTMEVYFYVEESRPPLWSSGQSSWLHNGDVLCFL